MYLQVLDTVNGSAPTESVKYTSVQPQSITGLVKIMAKGTTDFSLNIHSNSSGSFPYHLKADKCSCLCSVTPPRFDAIPCRVSGRAHISILSIFCSRENSVSLPKSSGNVSEIGRAHV